jgi:hypothetical protein
LILEDNGDRIREFEAAIRSLGSQFQLKLWHDAPNMIAECQLFLPLAALISLDHDLNPLSADSPDPGTGLDVANFLSQQQPVCPVIIHTSNFERRWSMHNELRFAHWQTEIVLSFNNDWIQSSWLNKVKALLHAAP